MTTIKGLAHASHSAVFLKVFHIAKQILLIITELIRDRISILARTENCRWRTMNNLTILHIKSSHFRQISRICSVYREKLCNYSHRFESIDGIFRSAPIEVGNSHTIWIDIATILVTNSIITFTLGVITAFDTFTAIKLFNTACVWCVGSSHAVGLPNIQLSAASAIFTSAHVIIFIIWIRNPIDDISFTINEFHIMRALCITISRTIFGAGIVITNSLSTVRFHLREVHGSVHTAVEFGDINFKREFTILQMKHSIIFIILHDIET
mmetsp:Transcript_25474/g.29100  ORF Transcript_25474/g.29100 Transcript_25474/m.29100 type:complete len:267 (-) Transcript_25474:745-1545(-)